MMTSKIEKAEMLPILVRAEEYAEKADAFYKQQMYNFIWEEHERGKSDIAEEDWNGIEHTQNKVYVEGIPLEISYKDFSGRLMGMGFKKEVEQKAETNGKEAFFSGRIRNVP